MSGRRTLICVGVNEHQHYPKANLQYAVNDAETVYEILKDPRRGGFDIHHLLINGNATKAKILTTLKYALISSDLGTNDVVLFYFSGHGRLDKAENLYLVPHDISPLEIDPNEIDVTTSIHLTDIEILLDNTKVGTAIFILDACHSGGSGKLLGHLKYKDNRNIVFIGASRFSEKAFESVEIGQGRFTLAFLESLYQTPSLDSWITLPQALAYVDRRMPEIAKGKRSQMLEITSHANNQNIMLAQNPRFSIDAVEFINEVKELCELSDANISLNIGDLPANIFVMIERKAFGTQNATLIGCFYNEVIEISDNEIEQFNKIEEQFLSERRVSSTLIITKNELLSSTKSRLNKSIGFRTLNQMIWQLIDFQRYLSELRREYKYGNEDRPLQPPLQEIYVPLSGQMQSSINQEVVFLDQVDLAIENWLKADNQPMSMLLGSYGTGKTTVTRIVSYKQAELFQNGAIGNSRVPIIFPLRLFPKYNVVDIGGFIVSYLRNFSGLKNMDFDAFQKMNHSGKLLLIFDGFDEMGTRVDRTILKRNFAAVCSLIKTGHEKIIVSSRPEVFLTDAEQKEIFSSIEGRYTITTFQLHPLLEDQFRNYVEKRVKYLQKFDQSIADWTVYYDQITSISDLKEIATRPVILEITISALPRLIRENIKISKANLYEYYLKGEIERQIVDKNRDFLLNYEQRLSLIQFVAMYLLAKDQIELSSEDVLNVVGANLLPEQTVDVEGFTRDFLSCSFMLREGQSYRFSHLSFLEYLTARVLISEIQNNKYYVLDKIVPKIEIVHFLAELIKSSNDRDLCEKVLWQWIISSAQHKEPEQTIDLAKNQSQELFRLNKIPKQTITIGRVVFGDLITIHGVPIRSTSGINFSLIGQSKEMYAFENLFSGDNPAKFVGGNALTTLCLLGELPKEWEYDSQNLSGANIIDFEFVGSIFQGTIFREGKFTRVNFSKVQMVNADFTKCIFNDLQISAEAILNCNFRGCQFNNVKFDVETLLNCDFRECQFIGAELDVAVLSQCDFRESQFNEVRFGVVTLSQCDFQESQVHNCAFGDGQIIQLIFEDTQFNNSRFDVSHISECDFKNAQFNSVLLEQATIELSNLSTISFSNSSFEECVLNNCFFSEGFTIYSEKGIIVKDTISVGADEEVIRQAIKSEQPGSAIHPGQHLAEILKESGISQAQFARESGISVSTISRIITGKRSITRDLAQRIASALNQSVDYWLDLQATYESNSDDDIVEGEYRTV